MIGHFEEKSGNKYLALDDVNEKKKVSKKNMKKFGKVLKKKLNWLLVVKTLKIEKNLGLNLMMICHWINI